MKLRVVREILLQRRRQLILLGSLFLLAGAVYLVRVGLIQQQLVDARRDWSNQRLQIKQKTLVGKAEQYDAYSRDYAAFLAKIPAKKDFARVIGELFTYADQNSLSVGSVTYKPEKNAHGLLEYQINIDVTGTYSEVKSFLADINQAAEVITVDKVSLSKGGKVFEEEVMLRATLTILFGAEG